MATQYANGRIVTDGLVLNLNAADPNSYPGTGTTWTDISGNGNNGTLTNGPTFSSANGGVIVFDGSDDLINCGNNSSLNLGAMTISAWIKAGTNVANYRAIIADESAGGAPWNYRLFLAINTGTLIYDIYGTAYSGITSTYSINDDKWHYVCGVREAVGGAIRIYIDGALNISGTDSSNRTTVANTIYIGASPLGGVSYPFLGSIPSVQIYNRGLSAQEILQNYNAQKARFGLK